MEERNDGRERRVAERFVVNLPNQIIVGDRRIDCRLVDISNTGALIETEERASVGADLHIMFPDGQDKIGRVVRLTETHIALSFPGELMVAPLLERAAVATAG